MFNIIAPEKIGNFSLGDTISYNCHGYMISIDSCYTKRYVLKNIEQSEGNLTIDSKEDLEKILTNSSEIIRLDIANRINIYKTIVSLTDDHIATDIYKVISSYNNNCEVYYNCISGRVYDAPLTSHCRDVLLYLSYPLSFTDYINILSINENKQLFDSIKLKSVPNINETSMLCDDSNIDVNYSSALDFESYIDSHGIMLDVTDSINNEQLKHYKNDSAKSTKEIIKDFLKDTKSKRKFGIAENRNKTMTLISDKMTDEEAQYEYDSVSSQFFYISDILDTLSEKFLLYID